MAQRAVAERLQSKSMHVPFCGCQIWLGTTSNGGYGAINIRGKMTSTHRASYAANVGDIPDGMHVLHRCDVRACINPEHLFLGTHSDNMADMAAKGRGFALPPERNPLAKLTFAKVASIRAAIGRQKDIAKAFDVSLSTVHRIKNLKTWKGMN